MEKEAVLNKNASAEITCLFSWARWFPVEYPQLKVMHRTLNDESYGESDEKKLKLEGIKEGLPNIFLPVSNNIYHGLYINLKVKKDKEIGETDIQNEWLKELSDNGFCAVVCYGWKQARAVIVKYLKNGEIEDV